MATGLCDLGYTVYQEISGDYGGIAQYLYFSPGTIVVTAVRYTYSTLHVFHVNVCFFLLVTICTRTFGYYRVFFLITYVSICMQVEKNLFKVNFLPIIL